MKLRMHPIQSLAAELEVSNKGKKYLFPESDYTYQIIQHACFRVD